MSHHTDMALQGLGKASALTESSQGVEEGDAGWDGAAAGELALLH